MHLLIVRSQTNFCKTNPIIMSYFKCFKFELFAIACHQPDARRTTVS